MSFFMGQKKNNKRIDKLTRCIVFNGIDRTGSPTKESEQRLCRRSFLSPMKQSD